MGISSLSKKWMIRRQVLWVATSALFAVAGFEHSVCVALAGAFLVRNIKIVNYLDQSELSSHQANPLTISSNCKNATTSHSYDSHSTRVT